MSLEVSPVFRHANQQTLLFGFELMELWASTVVMAVLYVFLPAGSNMLLIFLPSTVLAFTLKLMRRGKPPQHLLHQMRWHLTPGIYSPLARKGGYI